MNTSTALTDIQATCDWMHSSKKSGGLGYSITQVQSTHAYKAVIELGGIWPTPTPSPPSPPSFDFKGVSPGSRINSATDGISWELSQIASCTPGGIIRLDTPSNDNVIDAAISLGLKTHLLIGGTIKSPLPTPTQYAALVTERITKYKGKVKYVEVGGNEPNDNGIPVEDFAALVNAGSDAARAIDPSLVIMNGGLAPATNTLTYATQLIPLIKGKINDFNIHLYENAQQRGSWNNWDRCFHPESLAGAPTIRQVLDSCGMSDVRITSTESGGLASQIGVTAQQMYVANAYADFSARRKNGEKVGYILTYCMRDDEVAPGWGLCDVNHNHRPAWTTLQAASI